MQGAEVVGEQGHFRLRLADADAGSETSKQAAALVFAIVQPVAVGMNQRLKAERKPEIGRDDVVPTKSCGVMPMMVKAAPLSRTVLPSIAGSPAKRLCQ